MTDADREQLHRELLTLAGWPRALEPQARIEVLGYDAYLITDEKSGNGRQDIPHMDFDRLLSLLPDSTAFIIREARDGLIHVDIDEWIPDSQLDSIHYKHITIHAADTTRLDAFALAVRDYRKAAGNGNP